MKIAVISVTKQGDILAEKLKFGMGAEVFTKNHKEPFHLKALTKRLMESFQGIIFIASTGIAVRAIAPFLKSKDVDPAVLVIDCTGKYVISLLSGHLGGANELAVKAAEIIGAEPVITTASDNMGFEAPDMVAKRHNLVIEDLKIAKEISALMVGGETVAFYDEAGIIDTPAGYSSNLKGSKALVSVTNKLEYAENLLTLRLLRRDIVLGIGCRKNYSSENMKQNLLKVLAQNNIDNRCVSVISTVEIKKDEKAILELAQFLNCQLEIHSIEAIKAIQHKYKGSDFVAKTIGVRAVCEPCVELCGGTLLTEKISCDGMTVCVGKVGLGGLK